MKLGYFYWHLFFILSSSDSFVQAAKELRFVHALWRHGDRSPAGTFPTDTGNTEKSWPQGFGELTKLGVKQQYELGRALKSKYANFLSKNYSSKEIYIRSTSYNRTIMSALANLAGMYPPESKEEIWNVNITWQPIPVHSKPRESDPVLWMDRPCPKATKLYKKVLQTDDVKRINKENRHFFDFLQQKTGLKKVDLDDLWNIFDPLTCELAHFDDHKWPDWVNDTVYKQLVHVYNIETTFYYPTPELQRLRGGLLFNEIANRMKDKARNISASPLKYYAYSAHDTTQIALLNNLGVYDGAAPIYASVVLIELWEDDNSQFVVTVTKRNTTGEFEYTLPGCENPCTVDKFLSLAKRNKPDNWYKECGLPDSVVDETDYLKNVIIILGSICGLFFLLVLCLLVMYLNLRKNNGWQMVIN